MDKDVKSRALEAAPDGGREAGRDPRQMIKAELEALGHKAMSPIKALRLRCLDCCGGSPNEVRLCSAVACASWPFRMGENPWVAKRAISPEHLAKLRRGRETRDLGGSVRADNEMVAGKTPKGPPVPGTGVGQAEGFTGNALTEPGGGDLLPELDTPEPAATSTDPVEE